MVENFFDYLAVSRENRKKDLNEGDTYIIKDSKDILSKRAYAEKNSTYLSFLDDLIDVWNQKVENDREEGKSLRDIKIVKRYSTDDDKLPNAIVYRLIERAPSEEHKEKDFGYRGDIPDPYRKGEFIKVFSQYFRVDVEFRVISAKSDDADEIVKEFSSFLRRYKELFIRRGVHHFRFIRQGPDEKDMSHRSSSHIRPLYYQFRVEEFEFDTEFEIKEVNVYVNNKKHSEEEV